MVAAQSGGDAAQLSFPAPCHEQDEQLPVTLCTKEGPPCPRKPILAAQRPFLMAHVAVRKNRQSKEMFAVVRPPGLGPDAPSEGA